MSLLKKMMKTSTINDTSMLSDSDVYKNLKDNVPVGIPIINAALSGDLNNGLSSGLFTIAGPSRHFKTGFALLFASSFLKKHKDGIILFYDSEFGSPQSYFESFGIDPKRVLHTPITDIEQLRHDIMVQLSELTSDDKVMIIVDSIGNLASKKEVDDAIEGKQAADMTRAKQLKSMTRMVTPHLTLKNIPMICVNHTYKTLEMFSKDVVSGGTGVMYSSNTVWIIGRQQEKDGKELLGYNFIINVEKSRFVKEKSKIPVTVKFDGGFEWSSGLLELAIESGHIIKPKVGWYQIVNIDTGEFSEKNYRAKDLLDKSLWRDIIRCDSFNEFVNEKYKLGVGNILVDDADD